MADLLVASIEQLGVEYVFGVPGGLIEPLYDAMARSARRGGLRHVLARHEAGAAFMADGYARETGRLGVCCATAGPGATNLLTGVACARDNDIPLLVVTGQPALANLGRHALQESREGGVDTLGMFAHCTRYNSLVTHPAQFERKLFAALQQALRPPRGPAHLCVPVDVFRSAHAAPPRDLSALLAPAALVDAEALTALQRRLLAARKVVFVIGAGAAGAVDAVLACAERLDARVVTTPDGKGLVGPHQRHYCGVFGFAGHASAEAALRDAAVDAIVAVGVSFGEWNSGGWSVDLLNERLLLVDDTETHFHGAPMAALQLRGHLPAVFARLLARLRPATGREAPDACITLASPDSCGSDATPIKPQRLMRELGRLLPPGTRFLADTGNSTAWALHYLLPEGERRTHKRRQRQVLRDDATERRRSNAGWLRVTMNFAPMGWAIGAAVGTALASPAAPVVCITGDGSLLMNGQEISVAVAARLPLLFVVLNDAALGMVRHGQRLAHAEAIGCELPPTDIAALARALGAEAHVIHSPVDLLALDIDSIFRRPGPTLLDVRIDAEEVPPMGVRMRVLAAR
jgi:acetolactate synthase-1/2/3 large subunit